MPTVTKAFAFASNAEGFSANYPAAFTLSYDGATGIPVGALKSRITGTKNASGTSYWEWSGTWEQLGVPAGATVTACRLHSASSRCTEYSNGRSCTSGPYTLHDGSGTLLGTLWAGRSVTAVESSWTSIGQQADCGLSVASNAVVKIRLQSTLGIGASTAYAVSVYDDQVVLVITYSNPPTAQPLTAGMATVSGSMARRSGHSITAATATLAGAIARGIQTGLAAVGANWDAIVDGAFQAGQPPADPSDADSSLFGEGGFGDAIFGGKGATAFTYAAVAGLSTFAAGAGTFPLKAMAAATQTWGGVMIRRTGHAMAAASQTAAGVLARGTWHSLAAAAQAMAASVVRQARKPFNAAAATMAATRAVRDGRAFLANTATLGAAVAKGGRKVLAASAAAIGATCAQTKAKAFAANQRKMKLDRDTIVQRTLARLASGTAAHA
jgi:hypothetical protein